MAKNIEDTNKPQIHVADVVHHGEKLVLPEHMELDDAIDVLRRRKAYLTEDYVRVDTFSMFPWDGAMALHNVLQRRFGFTIDRSAQITVDSGFNQKAQIPWGKFSIPGTDINFQTDVDREDGLLVFKLVSRAARREEHLVAGIIDDIRTELKQNSMYRGRALAIQFRDDDGDQKAIPTIKFMDTSMDRSKLVYSKDVLDALNTNLFTPIERHADLAANGLPFKRGVLLAGTYGTGKTLAAKAAARLAEENDITYIYVRSTDEITDALVFARQYEANGVVIFCEDIDRVTAGKRDLKFDAVLNTIDGIEAKNTKVMVVLTTNDLESIHQAMLRPGRLDAVIEVTAPDAKAVEQLIRVYGAEAVDDTLDLAPVGVQLAGMIPAVIAEVVQRAKLAALKTTPPGEKVIKLTSESLLESAVTMTRQIDLINRNNEEPVTPTLDAALRENVKAVLSTAARADSNA